MKFADAMKDHTIKSVRLPQWANKGDVLEMPVLVDGCPTPWATLRGGGAPDLKILSLELIRDPSDAYEVVERYPLNPDSTSQR